MQPLCPTLNCANCISGADVRSIPNLPLCIALEYYKRTRPDRLLSESDEQENYTKKNNYVEGKVYYLCNSGYKYFMVHIG